MNLTSKKVGIFFLRLPGISVCPPKLIGHCLKVTSYPMFVGVWLRKLMMTACSLTSMPIKPIIMLSSLRLAPIILPLILKLSFIGRNVPMNVFRKNINFRSPFRLQKKMYLRQNHGIKLYGMPKELSCCKKTKFLTLTLNPNFGSSCLWLSAAVLS